LLDKIFLAVREIPTPLRHVAAVYGTVIPHTVQTMKVGVFSLGRIPSEGISIRKSIFESDCYTGLNEMVRDREKMGIVSTLLKPIASQLLLHFSIKA
jgi:hypothetical protein